MKILMVASAKEFGGIESNLLLLARELTTRGHSITVASAGGKLAAACATTGVDHIVVPMDLSRPWPAARSVIALRTVVLRQAFDLVHVFSATAAAATRAAALLARSRSWPPVVSSIMGLANSPREPRLLTDLRNFACTFGAARVLIISPEIRRMVERLPIRRDRLVDRKVVGVDVRLATRTDSTAQALLRGELGLEPDAPLVATIGGLAPRKSHELFIRAAALVLRDFPRASFVVVGEGPERTSLEAEIRRLGVGHAVRLLGERSDIASLLALTTVYVKPGIVEGFIGITVLEAQTMGCPVVAFQTEDVKLAIEDGVTGVLAARGDVGALAEAILRLLREPAVAATISAAARLKVEREFSIEAVVTELVAEYGSLIGSPPTGSRRRGARTA
jgi:glycosyltransferase involved in cell wall biosynthesis